MKLLRILHHLHLAWNIPAGCLICECWSCMVQVYSIQSLSLTHWGRVTHICVSKLTIIGSDNGLSLSQRQAIIWTYAGILLIQPWGTNFSEILIEIDVFSFTKIHLKMSSVKCRLFCLSLNVLMLNPWTEMMDVERQRHINLWTLHTPNRCRLWKKFHVLFLFT